MAKKKLSVGRYRLLGGLFMLIQIGIFAKVGHIIFIEGDKWRGLAEGFHKPQVREVAPIRGRIISSDGHLLAIDKQVYNLYMDFHADRILQLKRDTVYRRIDSIAQHMAGWDKGPAATYSKLRDNLRNGFDRGKRYHRIYPYAVDYRELYELRRTYPFRIKKEKNGRMEILRGAFDYALIAEPQAAREHPYDQLGLRTIGDVFGYVADSTKLSQGRFGLEMGCDSLLRGKLGLAVEQRIGGKVRHNTIESAQDGFNIYTTLSVQLQQIVDRALRDQLTYYKASAGVAMMMEVATGRIVAIANLEYNGNRYVEGVNLALSGLYEPGSTFKTPFLMAALEDGVAHPSDTIDTGNGVMYYGGFRTEDHNADRGGYGRISVAQGLWYSSNIVMAKLAIDGYVKDPNRFYAHLEQFGILDSIDLEIPGVAKPHILRPKDPGYGLSTVPALSRGYSVSLPAINTLCFYNAIANGGRSMHPYLVDRVEYPDGKLLWKKSPIVSHENFCSPETLSALQQMLRDVVEHGTGRTAFSPIVSISGKTGTARMVGKTGRYSEGGHLASFCGYFPSEAPQYSCIVLVVSPQGSTSGGIVAGRVVKRIAEEIRISSKPILLDTISPYSESLLAKQISFAGGEYISMERFAKEYHLPLATEGKIEPHQLVHAFTKADGVHLTPIPNYIEGVMPNLVGLAPDEAAYQLARLGLHVQFVGYGRVVGQGIPVGTPIIQGTRVVLHLAIE